MKNLSSRKKFKLYVGLAMFCNGAIFFQASSSFAQDCLPENNADLIRNNNGQGNYIICPDSYNDLRTYSAVVRQHNTDSNIPETIIDWGMEYTPLDGSWYYSPNNSDYKHIIRVTCSETEESNGVEMVPEPASSSSESYICLPDVKFFAPAPAPPEHLTHSLPGGGQINHKVQLLRPSARPDITNVPPGQLAPKAIAAAHIVGYRFRGKKGQPWESEHKAEDSDKRFLINSKIADPSNASSSDWQTVFNGQSLPERIVKNPNDTYQFFTEVLYYYGEKLPDGTSIPIGCRYRAARSEILEVNMAKYGSKYKTGPDTD